MSHFAGTSVLVNYRFILHTDKDLSSVNHHVYLRFVHSQVVFLRKMMSIRYGIFHLNSQCKYKYHHRVKMNLLAKIDETQGFSKLSKTDCCWQRKAVYTFARSCRRCIVKRQKCTNRPEISSSWAIALETESWETRSQHPRSILCERRNVLARRVKVPSAEITPEQTVHRYGYCYVASSAAWPVWKRCVCLQ